MWIGHLLWALILSALVDFKLQTLHLSICTKKSSWVWYLPIFVLTVIELANCNVNIFKSLQIHCHENKNKTNKISIWKKSTQKRVSKTRSGKLSLAKSFPLTNVTTNCFFTFATLKTWPILALKFHSLILKTNKTNKTLFKVRFRTQIIII